MADIFPLGSEDRKKGGENAKFVSEVIYPLFSLSPFAFHVLGTTTWPVRIIMNSLVV
jgi:hypothetical protein